MERDEILRRIRAFLDRVGIPHHERTLEGACFLPGLRIEGGAILVDLERLSYPGDLLHEAGHIALERPSARAHLSQEVLGHRPPAQSEEIGVLLWTFLAAREIGLPSEVVFHAGGYRGESSWLMSQFEAGTWIGLPLLVWMGVVEPDGAGTGRVRSWLRVNEP